MAAPVKLKTFRVGQNQSYTMYTYTVSLAGKSPNIRSHMAYIHSSGQPYKLPITWERKTAAAVSAKRALLWRLSYPTDIQGNVEGIPEAEKEYYGLAKVGKV